jgi:hypothetical protein
MMPAASPPKKSSHSLLAVFDALSFLTQPLHLPPTMFKTSITFLCLALSALSSHAFVTPFGVATQSSSTARFMSDDMGAEFLQQAPSKERIQTLVDDNPVLLFMKGSKVFPQCGFSNTAIQILTSFGIDFKTVGELVAT